MKPLNEEQIRSLLRHHPVVEPPPDLAEKIKSQIPESLPSMAEPAPVVQRPGWSQWLVAASLLVALGGGGLSLYLTREALEAPADANVAELNGAEESSRLDATRRPKASASGQETSRHSPESNSAASSEPVREPVQERGNEPSHVSTPTEPPAARPARKPQQAQSVTPSRSLEPSPPDATSQARKDETRTSDPLVEVQTDAAPSLASRTRPTAPRPLAKARPADTSARGGEAQRSQAPTSGTSEVHLGNAMTNLSEESWLHQSVESENKRISGLAEKAKRLEATLDRMEESESATAYRAEEARRQTKPEPRQTSTTTFVDVSVDSRSTFGLDVDTGSYSLVRRQLVAGQWPDVDQVRVEEMVNYFDHGDTPPPEGDFAFRAELAPSLSSARDGTHLLRLSIRARDVSAAQRPAALLVFVVDISGSMARSSRLPLVKEALTLLLQQLRPDDRVALVVYGSRGRVVLEPTADLDRLQRTIEGLRSEGATNVEEGLRLAYGIAAEHRKAGRIQRVILCSDGVANVGATTPDGLLEAVQQYAQQGVELTTIGFGMGDYNDPLMEQLANRGNGRYAYVDSLHEAHRLFVENLTGTLQTLAAEARAQLVFEADAVHRYRLLGYENREIEDHRFRDDRTDGGEIGAGHSVTVLYEVELAKPWRPETVLANLHLRYASIAQGEMIELVHPILGRDVVDSWQRASPAWRLSSLVANFAEGLKKGPRDASVDFDELLRRGQQLSPAFLGDRDVAELVALIAKAADLQER